MGRVKEIFIEVFADEIQAEQFAAERESKINKVLSEVSETFVSVDGPDYPDLDICPRCHEHCQVK